MCSPQAHARMTGPLLWFPGGVGALLFVLEPGSARRMGPRARFDVPEGRRRPPRCISDLTLGPEFCQNRDRSSYALVLGAVALFRLPLREDGLRLADTADVVYEEPPLVFGRHLNGNFAVGVTVSKEAGANAVTVCDEIKERIERMKNDPELQGVNLLIWFNQGDEIRKTLRDLTFTGLFGAILAAAVLYGFLRRFSMTMVSVLCIPCSLIVACGISWVQGKSLNTLTLLRLIVGIGMLVDNAVVVMENIFRHRRNCSIWCGRLPDCGGRVRYRILSTRRANVVPSGQSMRTR